MTYRVVFYCPDRHIEYDGSTPYEVGVGGGVTARVRMARALSRAGHDVKVVANCPRRSMIDGVEYIPLQDCYSIEADVLIVNTSGGAMDLNPLNDIEVASRMNILWVQGMQQPSGWESLKVNFLYAPSNFLATLIHDRWDLSHEGLFVTYNPYDENLFLEAENGQFERDPYQLVYCSHPSKGLTVSIAVLSKLREIDRRFHLAVYGGYRLWGGKERHQPAVEGLTYHGLIGQERLVQELMKCGFSLCLQTREEPFGIVLTESMRAGCVVLASVVGAYKELVRNGENGILIEGDPGSQAVQEAAASVVCDLLANHQRLEDIRARAQAIPWSSDRIARSWIGHWDYYFSIHESSGVREWRSDARPCLQCGSAMLALEDGYHCNDCGAYDPGAPQ
jgi:glycosyltransferase involved in cell wall biosynthesis